MTANHSSTVIVLAMLVLLYAMDMLPERSALASLHLLLLSWGRGRSFSTGREPGNALPLYFLQVFTKSSHCLSNRLYPPLDRRLSVRYATITSNVLSLASDTKT